MNRPFAPGMPETCADAIRGKPTCRLAWHVANAATRTVPVLVLVPKG